MTTRLIEACFEQESTEEEEFTRFITINIANTSVLVVDPYMINIDDLTHAKPGKVVIVRVRRPAWGRGNLNKYIYKFII